MIKITVCPTCYSDKIKKVRRHWIGKVQGQSYTVPNLEYYECPNCREKVYDRAAMRKIEVHSPAFSKRQVRKTTQETRKGPNTGMQAMASSRA